MNNKLHLSFSKIKTFEDCKLKYFFNYIYKIRVFSYNFHNVLGILTHFFIEKLIENDDITYRDIYNEYSKNLDKLKEDLYFKNFSTEQIITYSESDEPIDSIDSNITSKVEGIFEIIKQYDNIPLYQSFKFVKQSEMYIHQLKKDYNNVIAEIELLLNKSKQNLVYQGIIDILAINPKSAKIIDIKTSKNNNYLSQKQLLLYAYLYVNSKNIKSVKDIDLILEFYNVRNLSIKRYNLTQSAFNKFKKYLDIVTNKIIAFNKNYENIDNSDRYNIAKKLSNDDIKISNSLKNTIDNIINENSTSFLTLDKSVCRFCDYKKLCPIAQS